MAAHREFVFVVFCGNVFVYVARTEAWNATVTAQQGLFDATGGADTNGHRLWAAFLVRGRGRRRVRYRLYSAADLRTGGATANHKPPLTVV